MASITLTNHYGEGNGMPLGGIGTGSVEVYPDGSFRNWELFNLGLWAKNGEEGAREEEQIPMDESAMTFFIRCQDENGAVTVRKLGLCLPESEFRSQMYPFVKRVQGITLDGKFPTCTLNYSDDTMPVSVSCEICCPFEPHDTNASSIPAFTMRFRIHPKTSQTYMVSLACLLKNPVCYTAPRPQRINSVHIEADSSYIHMQSENSGIFPDNGSMCLSASGGTHSYITGEFIPYLKNYAVGSEAFGVSEESAVLELYRYGGFSNSEQEKMPAVLPYTHEEINTLDEDSVYKWFMEYRKAAFAMSVIRRIERTMPDLFETVEGRRDFLHFMRNSLSHFHTPGSCPSDIDNYERNWGGAALCSQINMQNGEPQTVDFTLSWYFPNHISPSGTRLGHYYENIFSDALDVNRHVVRNRDDVILRAAEVSDLLYYTSLPPAFAESWSIQLANLVKSSWLLQNGDFGIWEGIGSCGFHTMDITYHGSFPLLLLFPDLQKRQMLHGAQYQREDGRVHHFFTPDLYSVDNGFNRVDMNPQFVLLVCRDFMWTGDKEYLQSLWGAVSKAMDSIEALDRNGDGLPDSETAYNTYDAWRFTGTPSYIAGLWLGALSAAIYMADIMNDKKQSEKWRELLEKGSVAMENLLWNGSFYSLWSDGEKRDECCMTDQLDGVLYAKLLGLPSVLPETRVTQALNMIYETNYTRENGLQNATYRPSDKPTVYTHQNCQAQANWSGIEYLMAAYYMDAGMPDKATEIVWNVDDRHKRAGAIWSHVECGAHYYRAMASWATLFSAIPFRYYSTDKRLVINKNRMTAPGHSVWFNPFAYGKASWSANELLINCVRGTLDVVRITDEDGADMSYYEKDGICRIIW